jgi:hypothetical protein
MILMYREPYNYGYTEFVNPDLFAELQRMGILGPPMDVPKEYSLAPLSDQRRELMRELKWGSSLIKQVSSNSYYYTAQLYPVIQSDQ